MWSPSDAREAQTAEADLPRAAGGCAAAGAGHTALGYPVAVECPRNRRGNPVPVAVGGLVLSRGGRLRTAVFGASLLLIVAASAAAYRTVGELIDAENLVDHTQRVIDRIDRVLSSLREAEIGARLYAISGREDELLPYSEGIRAIPAEMSELRRLTADNAAQQRRLDALAPLVDERLAVLAQLIEARRSTPDFVPPSFIDRIDPPSDRRGQIRTVIDAMAGEENRLYQIRLPDAERRANLMLVFIPLATVVGALLISVVLFRANAEARRRQRAEARLTEANAGLEQRVAERTEELRRSGLRVLELQSELLHVARLSSMGQMSAALAHELNQPLTAIRNYVGAAERMLARDAPDAVKRLPEILVKTGEQVARAAAIIQQTREFIEKRHGDRQPARIGDVIHEAVELVSIGAAHRGTEIELALEDPEAVVSIDKIQIQQVLLNLLRNAIEAMADNARPRLVVSTAVRGGRMLEIAVADSGPGLSPEVARKLFEPFVTSKSDGLGVGLSICRFIVEAHGGRIWVDPGTIGGAVFRFTVPAEAEAAPAHALAESVPIGRTHAHDRPQQVTAFPAALGTQRNPLGP